MRLSGGGVFTRDGAGGFMFGNLGSRRLYMRGWLVGWRLAFPNARSLLWGGGILGGPI